MKATIKYTDSAGQAVELPVTGDVLIIGRDAGCGLVLDDPNVSKKHAQVIRVESEFIIRDQGSVNGTFVGEHRITHHTLRNGDVIRIGRYELLFQASEEAAGGALAVAGQPAAGAVSVLEAQPFTGTEWIEEKVAGIREREESRRRVTSWTLNIAIIGGIALVVLVLLLLRMQGGEGKNIGAVELEMGYAQLVPLPVAYGYAEVEAESGSGALEIMDQDTPALKELAALDSRFVLVKPSNKGAARIVVRSRSGNVYYITVLIVDKEAQQDKYADEISKAESVDLSPQVKAARAREWAQNARVFLHEKPFEAIEMARVAKAYADEARLDMPELESIITQAEEHAKARWKGLALQYSQSVKTADEEQQQAALEAMIRLLPDKKDPRLQWAQLRLEKLKADIAKRGRKRFPLG